MSDLLKTYESFVVSSAGEQCRHLYYCAMGIGGEAGEVVDAIKKSYRPSKTLNDIEEHRRVAALELGDLLWYMTAAAKLHFNLSLEDIIRGSVEKLSERHNMLNPFGGDRND